jgi:hypothetical protein
VSAKVSARVTARVLTIHTYSTTAIESTNGAGLVDLRTVAYQPPCDHPASISV